MVLSDAAKKRKSRAKKPAQYHAHERETSRKRMAAYRAKNRAQKRAKKLRVQLSEEDQRELEADVAGERERLLVDWFTCRGLFFDRRMMRDAKLLYQHITGEELHKIDLQVAEFEISMIQVDDDDDESPRPSGDELADNTIQVELSNPKTSDYSGEDVGVSNIDTDTAHEQRNAVGLKGDGDKPAGDESSEAQAFLGQTYQLVDQSTESTILSVLGLEPDGGSLAAGSTKIEISDAQVFEGGDNHATMLNNELFQIIKKDIEPLVTDAEETFSDIGGNDAAEDQGASAENFANPVAPVTPVPHMQPLEGGGDQVLAPEAFSDIGGNDAAMDQGASAENFANPVAPVSPVPHMQTLEGGGDQVLAPEAFSDIGGNDAAMDQGASAENFANPVAPVSAVPHMQSLEGSGDEVLAPEETINVPLLDGEVQENLALPVALAMAHAQPLEGGEDGVTMPDTLDAILRDEQEILDTEMDFANLGAAEAAVAADTEDMLSNMDIESFVRGINSPGIDVESFFADAYRW